MLAIADGMARCCSSSSGRSRPLRCPSGAEDGIRIALGAQQIFSRPSSTWRFCFAAIPKVALMRRRGHNACIFVLVEISPVDPRIMRRLRQQTSGRSRCSNARAQNVNNVAKRKLTRGDSDKRMFLRLMRTARQPIARFYRGDADPPFYRSARTLEWRSPCSRVENLGNTGTFSSPFTVIIADSVIIHRHVLLMSGTVFSFTLQTPASSKCAPAARRSRFSNAAMPHL